MLINTDFNNKTSGSLDLKSNNFISKVSHGIINIIQE